MGILQKNKPFFLFLFKFALSYLVLAGLYWLYLSQYNPLLLEVDYLTKLVAEQSKNLLVWFGNNASMEHHPTEDSYRILLNGKSILRIVEGCNAVSVMILFAAFIIAFSSTIKKTTLYIVIGIVIIHVLNILRIALFAMGLHSFPEQKELLHDIVFPLFIYGVVFALWVAWVMKFSGGGKQVKNK